jgi:tetratricopeptide (TPR) repeat protein
MQLHIFAQVSEELKDSGAKGDGLAKLERYEEAIEYYDKALAFNATDVHALHNNCNGLKPVFCW